MNLSEIENSRQSTQALMTQLNERVNVDLLTKENVMLKEKLSALAESLDNIQNSILDMIELNTKDIQRSNKALNEDIRDYLQRNNMRLEDKLEKFKDSNQSLTVCMSEQIEDFTDRIVDKTKAIDNIIEKLKFASSTFVQGMTRNIDSSTKISKRYFEKKTVLFYIACGYLVVGPALMIGQIIWNWLR